MEPLQSHVDPAESGDRFSPRRWVVLATVCLILPGVLVFITGFIAYGDPTAAFARLRGQVLYVENPTRSFGQIAPGSNTIANFEIINLCSRPVEVVGFRSTCGCAKVLGLPQRLKARERMCLKVSLTPSAADTGRKIAQSIQLLLDCSAPPVILKIEARISELPADS